MQKGFGVIGLVVIIMVLFLAVGGGFWLGRMTASSSNVAITEALFNQNQANSAVVQTAYSKRSYDRNQEIYPGYSLPSELVNAPEDTLTGFNCDGPYMQSLDGQYLWTLQLEGETYLKPLTVDLNNDITKVNMYLKEIGNQQPAAYFTYCVTETNKKYILVGQPMAGGGAGSDTYIFDLEDVNGVTGSVIKSEPWPYFGCSNILQISTYAMYVLCSAGDGGFSGQAIYKKGLGSSSVTPVIKCTSTANPDSESSEISCQ